LTKFLVLSGTALALGLSAFGGQAHAASCDGTTRARSVTVNCYYLPTVSNGRVTGLQKQVSVTYDHRYGGPTGGAVIGRGGRR
jgi:hypothetical protein